jgi:chorismate dehydratase
MIRIGAIPYLNCLPYRAAFEAGAVEAPGLFVEGLPADVNRGLLDGSIQIGPISIVALERARRDFDVVEDLAIASAGPVRSILVAADEPWADLGGREIPCDPASETSVALLEVLSRRSHAAPVRPRPEPDAAWGLFIGDAALRVAERRRHRFVHDLGALWDAATGLPMTYAVWVVRRDAAALDPAGAEAAVEALRAALAWGEARIGEIAPDEESRAYLEAFAAARRHPRRAEGLRRFLDEARMRAGGYALAGA